MKSNTKRYLVTDPCYVIENEDWDKFLTETDFGESVSNYKVLNVGTIIKCDSTDGGDGTWEVALGKEVSADAGLVCIVELEDGFNPTAYNGNAIIESLDEAEEWFYKVHYGTEEEEEIWEP